MRRLESDLVRVIEPRLGHKYACRYERVDTVSKLTGVVRNQSLGGVSVGLGLFAILKDTAHREDCDRRFGEGNKTSRNDSVKRGSETSCDDARSSQSIGGRSLGSDSAA